MPKTLGDLKRFLGLANYFRSHIQGYTHLELPLQSYVVNYNKSMKNKLVKWNDSTFAAFRTLQERIGNCSKLYYADPHLPTFVETDASDYGIGAYLYQQKPDNTQLPIAFMSRALQGPQRNWSTIEKECFAIYSALREWEHLLRDTKFTIRTDHNNLRYLNANTPKVVRWKQAIQEFDFHVEYVKGELNVVADALSRLDHEADKVGDQATEHRMSTAMAD